MRERSRHPERSHSDTWNRGCEGSCRILPALLAICCSQSMERAPTGSPIILEQTLIVLCSIVKRNGLKTTYEGDHHDALNKGVVKSSEDTFADFRRIKLPQEILPFLENLLLWLLMTVPRYIHSSTSFTLPV